MDWIWRPFPQLEEALTSNEGRGRPGESSSSNPNPILLPPKINDHVYEVVRPEGAPSVELVLFHGLQLDPKSSGEAHINTWVSRDGSACWLPWLLETIPAARILIVKYDGSARVTEKEGRMDMFVNSENLVHSLRHAKVGQGDCPVVLVGHCLGGLVLKEVCCQAHNMISLEEHSEAVKMFVESIRGCFFYATPHHGSFLADSNRHALKGPLITDLETLNKHTGRRNEFFRSLRRQRKWKTSAIVAAHPITTKFFEGVVVPDASARSDMDMVYTDSVNHYDVCRPTNKHSDSFQILRDFTIDIAQEWKAHVIEQSGSTDISRPQLWILRILCGLMSLFCFVSALALPFSYAFSVIEDIDNNAGIPTLLDVLRVLIVPILLFVVSGLVAKCCIPGVVHYVRFRMTGEEVTQEQLESELAPFKV